MYEKDAQFDRGWRPKRYPGFDDASTGVWRLVLEDGDPIGVIWLSADSAGVQWVTQTDGVIRVAKLFDEYAAIDTSAHDAYLVVTRATPGVTFSDEMTGQMSGVSSALVEIMDNITENAGAE